MRRPELPPDLPGLLVTNLPNIRALSGFTGTSAALVLLPDRNLLVTDFRYLEQVKEECPEWEIVRRDKGLDETLAALPLSPRLGFEAEHLAFETHRRLGEKVKVEWVPTTGLVEAVRMRKTPEEIEILRRAAELLESLFARIIPEVRPGRRENEIARIFEHAVLDETGEAPAFPPIVASGPRGALPHGRASARRIDKGDLVTLDLGLVHEGYNADMTRTVAAGTPSPRAREVHDAVRRALEAAEAGIRPGMTGEEAHKIAHDVLAEAGLGEAFGHGLGHGLGLEIHEGPRLAPRAAEKLLAGMVFTIEPGAYLPGWGGVRIEDSGVLTETGFLPFNRSSRGLEVID